MTDHEIINSLIARDEAVTEQFFFKSCRPLFLSIMRYVFSYTVDYDEFVNEFYLHLMEDDGFRLRQFKGRSSIFQWLKVVAIRYFVAKRDNMIDSQSKEYLLESVTVTETANDQEQINAQMDISHLLGMMPNRRYALALKRLVIDEAEVETVAMEMNTNVSNLYNIKKRALSALTELALNEIGKYEKRICKK